MIGFEPAHLVGAGGAFGAIFRHLLSKRLDIETYPVGTFTVNVLGTFLLACLTFAGTGTDLVLFFGVGAMGSFTTFSSFAFETVRLWETGERFRSATYAIGTFVISGAAVGLAWLLFGML